VVVDWTRLIVDGESLPQLTMADIDRANEARFAIDASCTWDVAVERLQRNGEAASAYVRTLSDEDLDRAATFTLFGGARVSAQTVIEQILIGDPLAHVASLREALLAGASTSDTAAS
jgi:hypothetical protein